MTIAGEVRELARYLGKRLGVMVIRHVAWSLVRGLAFVGFIVFAAATGLPWLHTAITKPFHGESISLRELYAVSATEHDIALLRQWLPTEGKVGYWSELPGFRLVNVRLHLAPLLLDPDWRKYDLVLVDYVAAQHRAAIGSPKYQLLADFPGARSFAGGMQIYRRKAR